MTILTIDEHYKLYLITIMNIINYINKNLNIYLYENLSIIVIINNRLFQIIGIIKRK